MLETAAGGGGEMKVETKAVPAEQQTDPTPYCPNCGHRGAWQKCKLVCENQRCGVRIILACVD